MRIAIYSACLALGAHYYVFNGPWPWSFCLTVFLSLYLAAKTLHILFYAKYWSPLRHIPGPKDGHFFFGQFLNLARAETPATLYLQWMRENPSAPVIRYLSFANAEVLVVNSPEAYKEVLQSQCYSFTKPDTWRRMVKDVAGKGILVLEGDEHRIHRKMLNGAFTPANMRRLGPVFRTKAREVSFLFDRAVQAGRPNGGGGGVIDCTETFTKATMDIIFTAIFGIDPGLVDSTSFGGGQRDKEYTFHEAYDNIFGQDTVGNILMFASGFVPTRWIPCEANRKFLFATSWLHETLYKLVRQRRQEIAAKSREDETGSDILSLMIEASTEGGALEGMTDEYIVGHLLILLSGGHDTSANTLSWCMYELAKRHDIQDALRAEMLAFEATNSNPTCAELDALPYLGNFVKEALRVYPPAVFAPRQAAATNITIAGIRVPKGTPVDVLPAPICMNPLFWGDDAADFRPDRWDDLTPSPHVYQVFSNGPRVCIGRQFALHEIKAVLFEVVRGYRFLCVEGPFTVENPALTLRPCGMKVRLERIPA